MAPRLAVECLTPEIWTTPRRQSIKEKRVEDFSAAALDDVGRPLECFLRWTLEAKDQSRAQRRFPL